jgi:hypothetical protein
MFLLRRIVTENALRHLLVAFCETLVTIVLPLWRGIKPQILIGKPQQHIYGHQDLYSYSTLFIISEIFFCAFISQHSSKLLFVFGVKVGHAVA